MERLLTDEALEASLVRACAPTLVGAKPASMFTVTGRYSDAQVFPAAMSPHVVRAEQAGDGELSTGARACGEPAALSTVCTDVPCGSAFCPCDATRERREELRGVIARFDGLLAGQGVRVRVVAWRSFGAIVLVFRPELLKSYLAERRVRAALATLGYPADTCLRTTLDHLARRFAVQKLPHEIGFFLGYPYEDVVGFVRHRGRDFICSGCWKVYGNPRRAMKLFSRYRRCARRCARLRRAGASVVDIAAKHRW